MANQEYKPPVKASELCWVIYRDHVKGTTHKGDSAGNLAINKRVGWIESQNEEVILHACEESDTEEQDTIRIARALILEIVPVIKPRAAKEQP